jgi:hypothetical protein
MFHFRALFQEMSPFQSEDRIAAVILPSRLTVWAIIPLPCKRNLLFLPSRPESRTAAQRTLLRQLGQAGASLHYHGDFDWPGLRIANHMVREHGARPWRLGASDYLTAICLVTSDRLSLKGVQVMASWDEALTTAMAQHRIAIAEEVLAGELLKDLYCR